VRRAATGARSALNFSCYLYLLRWLPQPLLPAPALPSPPWRPRSPTPRREPRGSPSLAPDFDRQPLRGAGDRPGSPSTAPGPTARRASGSRSPDPLPSPCTGAPTRTQRESWKDDCPAEGSVVGCTITAVPARGGGWVGLGCCVLWHANVHAYPYHIRRCTREGKVDHSDDRQCRKL
jgi:hypothetical protein